MPAARRSWLGPTLGYGLGVAVFVGLIWIAWGIGQSVRLNLLVLITSGIVGWIVGILMTPATRSEKLQFSEYGKALSTFVTGYALAKFDKIFEIAIARPEDVSDVVAGRFMLAISAFSLGILLTFIWRKYVSPEM